MAYTLKLHEADNVAVACTALRSGQIMPELSDLEVLAEVPRFHKIACTDIAAGESINKYNQIISIALSDIRRGEYVHTHNCGMTGEFICAKVPELSTGPLATSVSVGDSSYCFQGYRRSSGKAGTRNYIGILTSVNCSATVAKHIERHFSDGAYLADFPNVDGVVALTHAGGCGLGAGEGIEQFLLRDSYGEWHVTQACQVAGLGFGRDGSYNYYMSEPVVANDPKLLGPFIMLGPVIEQIKTL